MSRLPGRLIPLAVLFAAQAGGTGNRPFFLPFLAKDVPRRIINRNADDVALPTERPRKRRTNPSRISRRSQLNIRFRSALQSISLAGFDLDAIFMHSRKCLFATHELFNVGGCTCWIFQIDDSKANFCYDRQGCREICTPYFERLTGKTSS